MKIRLEVIQTIEEFLSLTDELKAAGIEWYRGQSNAEHQLLPSLFRETIDVSVKEPYYKREGYLIPDDDYALDEFKNALQKHKDCSSLKSIDYVYLMQHYDIPTRLLDFTLNPLVALYFCVRFSNENFGEPEKEIEHFDSNQGFSNKGGAIYCIDPNYVNSKSAIDTKVIDLNKYRFESLKNIDFPICISGNAVDDRIKAQEGVFIYFGNVVHPLDWYDIMQPRMVKIFIPNSLKRKFKAELRDKYKICHQTMFPDMKGVSLEIIDKMNEEFYTRAKASL